MVEESNNGERENDDWEISSILSLLYFV